MPLKLLARPAGQHNLQAATAKGAIHLPPGWRCASQTACAPWPLPAGRRHLPLPAGRPCARPTASLAMCLRTQTDGDGRRLLIAQLAARARNPSSAAANAGPHNPQYRPKAATHPARRRRLSFHTEPAVASHECSWLLGNSGSQLISCAPRTPPQPFKAIQLAFMSVQSSSRSLCSCSTA